MIDQIERWNKGHRGIPKDKSVSNYAIEKERLFPSNARVLDLGGGTGADSIYFLQHNHVVTLVDISDFALTAAKEKAAELGHPLTTLRITLGEEPLTLVDNSAEVIFSRLALHYFDRNTTVSIFKDMNRILVQNGNAYITIKSPDDKKEMDFLKETAEEIEEGVFIDDGETKSRFTDAQWEDILKAAGITKFTVRPYKEDMTGKIDKVKSGNLQMTFTEILLSKV